MLPLPSRLTGARNSLVNASFANDMELWIGRGNDEIMGAEISLMGMVPTPLLCLVLLLLGWSLTSPLLPFGTHPVVSLQDPLKSVIRLLQFGRVPRVVIARPSRLILVPKVLPLGLLRGDLQKPLRASPTLPQVEMDEEWVLPSSLSVCGSLLPALVLDDNVMIVLEPLLVIFEKLFSACTPLVRPCPTLVRLQVVTPLLLTLVFSGLGSLAPKFVPPLLPRPLLLDGVKTNYTVLRKRRNTLVKIRHPSTLSSRPNPPTLPSTPPSTELAKKSPYSSYFPTWERTGRNDTWNA